MDSTGRSLPERMAKALTGGHLKCQRADGWASFRLLSRYLKAPEVQLKECALVNDSEDFRFTTQRICSQLFIRCDRYEAAADESSAQDTSSCNAERQVPIGAPQRRPARHQAKFRFNRSRVQQATIIGAPQQRRAGRQGKASSSYNAEKQVPGAVLRPRPAGQYFKSSSSCDAGQQVDRDAKRQRADTNVTQQPSLDLGKHVVAPDQPIQIDVQNEIVQQFEYQQAALTEQQEKAEQHGAEMAQLKKQHKEEAQQQGAEMAIIQEKVTRLEQQLRAQLGSQGRTAGAASCGEQSNTIGPLPPPPPPPSRPACRGSEGPPQGQPASAPIPRAEDPLQHSIYSRGPPPHIRAFIPPMGTPAATHPAGPGPTGSPPPVWPASAPTPPPEGPLRPSPPPHGFPSPDAAWATCLAGGGTTSGAGRPSQHPSPPSCPAPGQQPNRRHPSDWPPSVAHLMRGSLPPGVELVPDYDSMVEYARTRLPREEYERLKRSAVDG